MRTSSHEEASYEVAYKAGLIYAFNWISSDLRRSRSISHQNPSIQRRCIALLLPPPLSPPLSSPSFPPFSPFSLLPFFPSLPLALPRVSAAWIPHDAPGIPSDLHAENVHRRSARARIHRGEPRPCFHARARVFLLGRTPAGEGPYRAVLARERVVVRLHFFFVLLAGH